MASYQKGEIWLGKLNEKNRPLLIIGNSAAVEIDRTVLTITSQQERNQYDVHIEYWEEAGLDKPSIVRCSKLNTVTYMDLIFKIGNLHEYDFENVKNAVRMYLE